jgi:hypothetical protein
VDGAVRSETAARLIIATASPGGHLSSATASETLIARSRTRGR